MREYAYYPFFDLELKFKIITPKNIEIDPIIFVLDIFSSKKTFANTRFNIRHNDVSICATDNSNHFKAFIQTNACITRSNNPIK